MVTSWVGANLARVEGEEKITGKSRYVDDLIFDNLLYGATVRSHLSRGTIREIVFAEGVPWSEFVIVQAGDIAGTNWVTCFKDDQPYLASKYINHAHEPVVLLAHPDRKMVEYARNFVKIIIDPLPAVYDILSSARLDPVIYGKDNILSSITINKGDCEQVFAQNSEFVVEGVYETEAQEQLYIECNGMVASVNSGVITVQGSMQCPYYVQQALKKLFHLSDEKVRVIQTETGGGFGGKEDYPSIIAGHAALLAFKSGKTVKLIYERAEDMQATTKRHPSRVAIKSTTDESGALLAIDIDFKIDGGAYTTLTPVVLSRGAIHALGPYFCDNVRINGVAFATNLPPHGAFRGFGAPQTIFAIERHIDRIAQKLKIAPEEIRRRNFIAQGQKTATGQIIREEADLNQVLDLALKESNFYAKREEFALKNKASSSEKYGIGLASFWHGAGFTGSGEKYLSSVIHLTFADGFIQVLASSTEIGQGTNTIFRQIVADALKISPNLIRVARPDTHAVPDSGPTVASRTCMIVGALLKSGAEKLVTLLQGCDMLTSDYSETEFISGAERYTEKFGKLLVSEQYQTPPELHWNEKTYEGDAYPCFVRAVYVAEVKVDLLTYESSVERFTAVQEVGKVINPILAQGQIEGGVTQGIGYAIMEKVVWREGSMANAQLTNYIIPTAMDAPEINVFFQEGPNPYGPHGAKGIGELPLDGTAPAIISAIENATGRHINRIPLLPEDLLKARGVLEN